MASERFKFSPDVTRENVTALQQSFFKKPSQASWCQASGASSHWRSGQTRALRPRFCHR